MNDLAPVLGMITLFLVVGWVIKSLSVQHTTRAALAAQTELHTKLLERFGSTQELRAYLESEAGRKMLDVRLFQRVEPYARLLSAVRTGILVIAAGIGLLTISGMVPGNARDGFTVLGTLGLVLGAGFLVSAAVSHLLAKRLGLLDTAHPEEVRE